MGKQLLVSTPPAFGILPEWLKRWTPLNMHLRHTSLISLITRGVKSTEMLYSSKSTITLMKFYLSTSKITHLKIYSSKSKK